MRELMAATLKTLGFKLIGDGPQTDVDKPTFERLIRKFGQELTGELVGIFYYAGHGLQVQGVNFLVPVDANPVSVTDTDFELIDAGLALKQMEAAGSRLNIVILDACRNNPFGGRGMRDVGSGLAVMRAPRGTIISYATQPGNVARDGTDGHSPYSRALAESMTRPGNRVLNVFNDVGLKVDKATARRAAAMGIELTDRGRVLLHQGKFLTERAPVAAAVPRHRCSVDAELLFWQSIAGSTTPADFDAYLRHYPQGRFVDLARNRLLALNQPAKLPGYRPRNPNRRQSARRTRRRSARIALPSGTCPACASIARVRCCRPRSATGRGRAPITYRTCSTAIRRPPGPEQAVNTATPGSSQSSWVSGW